MDKYDVHAVHRQGFGKLLFEIGHGLLVRQRLAQFEFTEHSEFNWHGLLKCLDVSFDHSVFV